MRNLMKRLLTLSMVVILVFALVGCSSSNGNSQDKAKVYEFKLGTTYKNPSSGSQFNSFGIATQKFCDDVKEKTDGQVIIKPFYDRTLGGNLELFEQVRRGEIEVYIGQPMASVDKRFGVLSLPYLFKDTEEVKKLVCDPNGAIYGMIDGWMDEYNLKLMAVGPSVFRGFANNVRPIKLPEDLKGIAVRIYQDPVVQAFWEEVASPTQLPFGEVYTSLQTGTVNGLEFSPTGTVAYKIMEVVDYYSDIDWQWTFGMPILFNNNAFDKLPAELQEIVKQCALDAAAYSGELSEQDIESAYKTLEENGVKVTKLSDEERQNWIEFSAALAPKFKEIIGEETYNNVIAAIEAIR